MSIAEPMTWNCVWGVRKFDDDAVAWATGRLGRTPLDADFAALGISPYENNTIERNLLTTAGLTRITSLITGGGGTAFNNTNSRIGVGDGSGTAAVGDTDLSAVSGSTHRWFQLMDATFPTVSAGAITFQATFTSANGNFAWSEFGIDNGTGTSTAVVTAPLLNHKTSIAQGTKTAGQSWTAVATVTLS